MLKKKKRLSNKSPSKQKQTMTLPVSPSLSPPSQNEQKVVHVMVFVCFSNQSAAAQLTLQNICSCRIGAAAVTVNQTVRVPTFKILQDFPFVKQHHCQLGPPLQHRQHRSLMGFYIFCQLSYSLLLFLITIDSFCLYILPVSADVTHDSRLPGIHSGNRLMSNLLESCLLLCINSY